MKLFNKKAKEEEASSIKSIEDVAPNKDENDKQLIIQSLMEDPEVKAYLAVLRGGEKFRIAAELQKEN